MRGYLSTRSRVQVLTGLTAFALLVYSVSVYNLAGSQLALQGLIRARALIFTSVLLADENVTTSVASQVPLAATHPTIRSVQFATSILSGPCLHLVPQFNYPSP